MQAYNEKTGAKKEVRKDIHGSKYIKETEFSKRIYVGSPCFLSYGYILKEDKK